MTMMTLLVAATAELVWTFPGGNVKSETVEFSDRVRIAREDIRRAGASSLTVYPETGRAKKGESGYWFSPYGYYGEWDCSDGKFVAVGERMSMPMYGWATPRGATLAIVTSMPYYGNLIVTAKDGDYRIGYRIGKELCLDPYEDLEIAYRSYPAGTGYGELCRGYRDYQLKRGAVKPLVERTRENAVLKYAVEAPEIRIRLAWKPVPSPEPYQQPENEPPVRAVVTFERVKDIVRELKRQGVEKAELCLVGWNIGGHDGRWPQYFPAEPKLGGDAKLKEAIACAKENGYLIVPHGNFIEGYTIAEDWDYEYAVKDRNGEVQLAGSLCWGGGQPIKICPQRAYERQCGKIMPRLAACGFRGLGYFDVVSILRAHQCFDPRHPCSWKDGARWWGKCAELSKRHLGGFASEGAMDHFIGSLDSVLYASFDSPQKVEESWKAGKHLAKRMVPIFQLVYNGCVVQNPFTPTVNVTAQDKYWQLKLIEFNGRPNFYFYSKFMTDPMRDWMGKGDLGCLTDEQLAWSVGKIKEGADLYRKLGALQYAFMENHEQLSPGVVRTSFSNGATVTVDYNKQEWKYE